MMKTHYLKLGIALSLAGIIGKAMAAEDANSAYREGYSLVLAQKWEEAQAYFGDFQSRWQDSEFADDAGYWHCYSAEQASANAESNFSCYGQFIEQWRDTGSNWVDDARDRMMVIANTLAGQGRPQFLLDSLQHLDLPELPDLPDLPDMPDLAAVGLDREEINRRVQDAMEQARAFADGFEPGERGRNFQFRGRAGRSVDSELLALISALQDDPRAGELLISRLEATDDPAMQARLVLMLQDLEGPGITDKLIDMARNSTDENVQRNAILALLDREDDASRAMLQEVLADTKYPVSARTAVIRSLAEWDEQIAVTQLSNLLSTETNVRLIGAASRELMQINSAEARSALIQHYRSISDPRLRRELLEQMEGSRSPELISFFTEVALGTDEDEAAIAVNNLASLESDMGIAALEHVYTSTASRQLQLAVIHGMGEAETKGGVDFLGGVVENSDDEEYLQMAARALGESEQEEAIPLLMQVYHKTASPEVKSAAVRAMSELGDFSQARESMLEMLGQELEGL